jgi:hypothetical protein
MIARRLGVHAVVLLTLCSSTVTGAHAKDPTPSLDDALVVVKPVADEANVDPRELVAAVATSYPIRPITLSLARTYLCSVGELVCEQAARLLDWRVACIESKESQGNNVWNRSGSGAGGVMQYMETTFQSHAREMGHVDWSRWVPWQAELVAAHDLALGRRTQWTVSGCT